MVTLPASSSTETRAKFQASGEQPDQSSVARVNTYQVKNFTIGYGSEATPLLIRIDLANGTHYVVRFTKNTGRIELVDTNEQIVRYWIAD